MYGFGGSGASRDLVGCHHSGTTDDDEQGKIGLLSQWTMEG